MTRLTVERDSLDWLLGIGTLITARRSITALGQIDTMVATDWRKLCAPVLNSLLHHEAAQLLSDDERVDLSKQEREATMPRDDVTRSRFNSLLDRLDRRYRELGAEVDAVTRRS